jgi:Zn-dependent protease
MMSLVLPAIFLIMGGIPLPGGATYIRRDLLRSRFWDSAVSAAGPLMNLLLFALLAIPLSPAAGWIDTSVDPNQWTTTQKFVSAMCFLQLFSVFLNLVPVPPLDGFGIIAPYLNPDLRVKLSTPPVSSLLFFGYFMVLWQAPLFTIRIYQGMHYVMGDNLFFRSAEGMSAAFHR